MILGNVGKTGEDALIFVSREEIEDILRPAVWDRYDAISSSSPQKLDNLMKGLFAEYCFYKKMGMAPEVHLQPESSRTFYANVTCTDRPVYVTSGSKSHVNKRKTESRPELLVVSILPVTQERNLELRNFYEIDLTYWGLPYKNGGHFTIDSVATAQEIMDFAIPATDYEVNNGTEGENYFLPTVRSYPAEVNILCHHDY